MSTGKTNTTAAKTKPPHIVKRIGNTTYKVNVHFSTTSKETINDKIMRLLQNDVSAETQQIHKF
jgi:hypothetical protein